MPSYNGAQTPSFSTNPYQKMYDFDSGVYGANPLMISANGNSLARNYNPFTLGGFNAHENERLLNSPFGSFGITTRNLGSTSLNTRKILAIK